MNQTHSHPEHAHRIFGVISETSEAVCCATPDCHNAVTEPWEETGTLCAACAVEGDLADRVTRWDRIF